MTKPSPRHGIGSLIPKQCCCSACYKIHQNQIQTLTVVAVAEEGACQGVVHHTCQGEPQEEEACQVLEVPACPGAYQVGADHQDHPCQEEVRASSEEVPWASVHTCLVEVQEEAAWVVHQAGLGHSLAGVLVPEALASSDQEDAYLEEVRLEDLALDGAHIALEEGVQEVSLPESAQQAGAYRSQAQLILAAAAASYLEQGHRLLSQVLQAQVELD